MRYIANRLIWRNDPFKPTAWVKADGTRVATDFCFGGDHDWQSPRSSEKLFAAEKLDIIQARAWLARDPFHSLVVGSERWGALLSSMLGLEVKNCRRREEKPKLQLSRTDVVLRAGVGEALHDRNDREILEALTADHELAVWYLHYLRPFARSLVDFDAGL